MIRSVAIIGGGFSGTLQAINLLRHDGPRAILVERRPEPGRGVAFSAADPNLLLNVRAANMSALPDERDHFSAWLERRGLNMIDGFAPRVVYGEYLAELLQTTRATAPDRLEIVQGDAVAARPGEETVVQLADGRRIVADALVLAVGNLPPAPPDHCDPATLPADCYAADPWSADVGKGLANDDRLLIVGTGLTMVDAALLLDAQGFGGRIVALSRRGLAPRAHDVGAPVAAALARRPPVEVSALLAEVRGRADEIGWRAAIDQLRPYTQTMWLAASERQRMRFLRHLRPWWEAHRHRIAPTVAEKIARLRASGRLVFAAGKTRSFEADGASVRVGWRPRGGDRIEEMTVRRVINCSGPQIDLDATAERLLRDLHGQGAIMPDAMRLGLAVDALARVIGADGRINERLYALGPLTRGTFWEMTAVPDIRVQTWTVARRLSNAHWVEGEGL